MRILVAIDSSTYAEEVLEQLALRSWPADTSFRIVTAVESSANWDTDREFQHSCQVILDRRIDYFKTKLPALEVTGQVLAGKAADVIVREARDLQADLVVIGSHGDTGKRMSTIGSVAAEVVNAADCSVEVIKLRRAGNRHTVSDQHQVAVKK